MNFVAHESAQKASDWSNRCELISIPAGPSCSLPHPLVGDWDGLASQTIQTQEEDIHDSSNHIKFNYALNTNLVEVSQL